jgi:hypothetical protein
MVSDFNENWFLGFIEILPILSAAIFEMAAIRSQLFLVRIFYQPYLIYMPSLVEIPLAGSDEICIQGHFCEATIFKMTANKIVKLSMVSDFNENWFLGLFWREELIGNDENCIQGHFYFQRSAKFQCSLISIKIDM